MDLLGYSAGFKTIFKVIDEIRTFYMQFSVFCFMCLFVHLLFIPLLPEGRAKAGKTSFS